MSADNGIYILKTKSKKSDDLHEFRVAYHQGKVDEEVVYEPDWPNRAYPRLNKQSVVWHFNYCEVIADEDDAYERAFQMEIDLGYPENGVNTLDFGEVEFPHVTRAWWILFDLRWWIDDRRRDFRYWRMRHGWA